MPSTESPAAAQHRRLREHARGGVHARRVLLSCCVTGLLACGVTASLWFGGSAADALVQDATMPLTPVQYLRARPFDALALSGVASALESGPGAALEAAAGWLAPMDPQVQRQRAQRASSADLPANALRAWARLAALSGPDRGDAFVEITRLSAATSARAELMQLMATGWPVASDYVQHLCSSRLPADVVLAFAFDALSRTPLRPATADCVSAKAIAAGLAAGARWFWINSMATLPATLGNVFNGSFDTLPSGSPFDWSFGTSGEFRSGFVAAMVPEATRGDTRKVLSVRFNGRAVQLPIVQQVLALPEGAYDLSYLTRESGFPGPSNVAWTIRCVGAEATALTPASTRRDTDVAWMTKSVAFAVPASCPGQIIRLELGSRLDMLQGLNGTVYFDDVVVTARAKAVTAE